MTRNRNFVAKHSKTYNKAAIHRDRKKSEKKGYRKHKNPRNGDFPIQINTLTYSQTVV